MNHIPPVVWLTGLSGAGKTTLAKLVCGDLARQGHRVHNLDGDEVRKEMCADLGFSPEDRVENIRRIAFVAKLLSQNGIFVVVSVISPLASMRRLAREKLATMVEVHVNAPLAVCEKRDPRGLYKLAREGKLTGFTGVDSPYEDPAHPNLVCHTASESVDESTRKILAYVLETWARRTTAEDNADPYRPRTRRRTLAVDYDGLIAS